ncbi:methylmalonyl Co-A mutase-associated GTPase MeaB [Bradyrhizobium sp.]|uniref:methylmalonyl Co-A mutase-associated GTPase MeaB n=1 Tax=Bradyrhizobium sp. TaxID=376 RepID=UPI003C71AD43
MSDASLPAHAGLVDRLLKGDPRALARTITAVENESPGSSAILAAIQPHLGRSNIIGVTGPPGAGKSTLIDAMIRELRLRGRTVGVLAVDPSSPISGGAILGDRIRMNGHAGDPGVFVRSLASRGHLGGLFRAAWGVVQAMDAYGPDHIIVETVGAGQSEVEIVDVAHMRLVLCAAGAGDDIQALKAGILEIADILVVNKSDHPMAEQTTRQLEAMLGLRDPRAQTAKIMATVATTGQGLPELVDELEAAARGTQISRRLDLKVRLRRILADATADIVRARILAGETEAIEAICDRIASGEIAPAEAARGVLLALRDEHAGDCAV